MSKEVKNEKLGKRVPLFESKEIKPVTESINKDFVEIIVNNNTSKEVQKEISKLYKPSWTGIEAEDNYNDEVSFPISQSLGFNNEDDLISDLNKNLSNNRYKNS